MVFSLILVGVVLALLWFIFKFKEIQHKVQLIFIGGFVLFALGSIWTVYSRHDIDITTFDGFLALSKFYLVWLKQLGHNIADISGYVIHQDWTANSTNVTR